MKRSEMVKRVYDIIGAVDGGGSVEEVMGIASDALKACEEAGMLPPGRPVIVEHAEPYELIEGFPLIGSIEDRNTWEEEQ